MLFLNIFIQNEYRQWVNEKTEFCQSLKANVHPPFSFFYGVSMYRSRQQCVFYSLLPPPTFLEPP